jgi:hypothetical protein
MISENQVDRVNEPSRRRRYCYALDSEALKIRTAKMRPERVRFRP